MNNSRKFDDAPSGHSTSHQPHRFFERYLENDLAQLAAELQTRNEKIAAAELIGVTPLQTNGEFFLDAGSVSTSKWRQYNVFQFHIPGIHSLFVAIREMVIEACTYYGVDYDAQQYMVQGWFNVNTRGNGHLGWHDHGAEGSPNFHGYYCVAAEPSTTLYQVFGQEVENVNINNRAILSEMGHPHSQQAWDRDFPRITVAYDVVPLRDILSNKHKEEFEQHWIPLA